MQPPVSGQGVFSRYLFFLRLENFITRRFLACSGEHFPPPRKKLEIARSTYNVLIRIAHYACRTCDLHILIIPAAARTYVNRGTNT